MTDVGVAGLHRLLDARPLLEDATSWSSSPALPSVVGGFDPSARSLLPKRKGISALRPADQAKINGGSGLSTQ
ncbi:MAG: hypothetical protein M3P93_11590 [Actinomycetota bacterium]|nr:hypothetical protein [Actinomycetota bacterium]